MNPGSICLSLYGTTEEICEGVAASSEADLFEIRMDLSAPLECARIRSATFKPLIFAAPEKPELLRHAARFANYLDVDGQLLSGPKYIVSIHASEEDPEKLWERLAGEHQTKIVLETNDYSKISRLLQLNRKHHPKAICFAMGEVGAFSRILSIFQGAPWLYASLPERVTAPGQFLLQELVHIYRIKRFDSEPRVFGIVGNPVAHSKSPEFHNRAFAEHSLPWIYLPFLCHDLRSLFHHAPDFGVMGFSITHPYKEEVLALLDEVSQEARRLRSCNTVCLKNGRWLGTNTDVVGAEKMLKEGEIPLAGASVAILGAGGAARAIASVVRKHARELVILNRTVSKASDLASEFECRGGGLEEIGKLAYDVLFQATSIGLKEGESPIDPETLRAGSTVIDVIYEPAETLLLKKARDIGCKTVNGRVWFEAQAQAQFDWWKRRVT